MAGFNSLDALAARQQIMMLGGHPAAVFRVGGGAPIEGTCALIDRDIEVVIDNGLAITRRTVLSLPKADVAQLRDGDTVIANPEKDDQEKFVVADQVSDDGVIVKVYVRG